MKKQLFVYGSLILGNSPVQLTITDSVYLTGYKLVKKDKPEGNYTYLLLKYTGKKSDIVSGYLAAVTNKEIERIDQYEGGAYQRVSVTIYKRDTTEVRGFAYTLKK